ELRGGPAQVVVVRVEPAAAVLVVPAEDRIQAAVGADEQERQLALLAAGFDEATRAQAGEGGLADPEDACELFLPQTQEFGRPLDGAGQHAGSLVRRLGCGL